MSDWVHSSTAPNSLPRKVYLSVFVDNWRCTRCPAALWGISVHSSFFGPDFFHLFPLFVLLLASLDAQLLEPYVCAVEDGRVTSCSWSLVVEESLQALRRQFRRAWNALGDLSEEGSLSHA